MLSVYTSNVEIRLGAERIVCRGDGQVLRDPCLRSRVTCGPLRARQGSAPISQGERLWLYTSMFSLRAGYFVPTGRRSDGYDSVVLEENGGKITKKNIGALNRLLTGSKNRKGHYSLLNIDAEHGAIAEMERRISLNAILFDS